MTMLCSAPAQGTSHTCCHLPRRATLDKPRSLPCCPAKLRPSQKTFAWVPTRGLLRPSRLHPALFHASSGLRESARPKSLDWACHRGHHAGGRFPRSRERVRAHDKCSRIAEGKSTCADDPRRRLCVLEWS